MQFRRSALATIACSLLCGSLAYGQTSVVCHVKPIIAQAGSGVANPTFIAVTINRWGNVVGGDAQGKPFIRFSDGRVQPLKINIPHAIDLKVDKRNASGVTVGTVVTVNADGTSRQHGFMNANGKSVLIDFPGAVHTDVHGINRYGTIVGNFIGKTRNGSFRLKDGKFSEIHPPPAFARHFVVRSISDKGVIVGTFSPLDSPPDPDETTHGFMMANGTFHDLAIPGLVDEVIPTDINASGMIVGSSSGDHNSFILRNGQYFFPEFVQSDGTSRTGLMFGVNGFGQIAGFLQETGTLPRVAFLGKCDF